MHKPEQITSTNISPCVKQRKGFALILTLSALAVIIALSAVLVSYLDIARKDANSSKAMIQGNIYYSDIKALFGSFQDKKLLYETIYSSPIPISSEDGKFTLIVSCKPLANAVNINWLAYENNASMTAQYNAVEKIFFNLAQEYNMEDAANLETMLRNEIVSKQKYIQKEKSRLRQKNGIISIEQFKDIVGKYQRASDDKEIYKIPWTKYFVFNELSEDPKDNVIEGNYISAELLAYLFDIDYASVKEDWSEGSSLKDYVLNLGQSYNQKLFSKEFLSQSRCEVFYDYGEERYGFKFEDREGEVKHFEFLGKQ
ncbi:hypothetical protein MNB_SV-5-286 [hydrothermal vent metagenome]|uniref:General secretion pathway protein K n=1 Tax=hydrothermal vent metagenome TaxID=652676 RepID=A0A1W1EBE2_9ZZZZ